MFGYTCLTSKYPRSYLFAVVANVGPHGTSRSLAVAYRQGNDSDVYLSDLARMRHVVTDILTLIDILSDPANRGPLEAERALAQSWYRRSLGRTEAKSSERPSVPDSPQPPFVMPGSCHLRGKGQLQPELPWHDDALSEFPFTTTCLLLGLLRDDGHGDTNVTNRNSMRPGDVQLQPLSTVFRGDCAEYGLVVLDISDFDSGVKYGIVGFPVRYMADVWYRGETVGWDYVEDRPPEKEPDVVLFSPRPRAPLSILQWLRKYTHCADLEDYPNSLRLEDRPLVDAAALDYFWPSKPTTRAKEASLTIASRLTTSRASTIAASRSTMPYEVPQKSPLDRAIDNLLILTQEPGLHLDEETIGKFQKLAEFREQLRRRLEEVPDSLGPFSEASSHILRVAYAGCTHLNWVAFKNLAPGVIAAAVASDELRNASALSLCVDEFKLEGDEGDLGDLAAVLGQSTTLNQLYFLQGPERDSDDASARFYTQLLLRGRSSGDLGWLRDKTIYPTCAFSTPLCNHRFTWPSTASVTFTSPDIQVFPVMHMFTFRGYQREDVADADHHLQQYQNSHSYSRYYDMSNTLLDAERFAVRFLSYLHSVGSGSDKAILRFAYEASSPITTTTTTENEKSPPPFPSSGQFAASPIPAGFFGNHLAANDQSRIKVRVRYIQPGSWVILLDQRGRSLSDESDVLLRYSFVRIRGASADIAPENQQQSPVPAPASNFVDVVGGVTEFLRETVPGIDISPYEKRVEDVGKDLHTRRASLATGKRRIDIGVMAESSARALLDQLL
ncbi:uncharacterized protein N7500_008408 [Penicillium coprophilum]|uniref:uncharacterized protein n=1 Tax=Penicillium coprophilum TaxID=36646 RepID=UPI002387D478|nr:uncharacterized protein N7500_008408 [Penicillium coprophilum]KAJ5158757.1 hypothetical protein N7500_008408 [Penicillium coprophilum]